MTDRRIAILIASSHFPKEPRLDNLHYPENDVDGLVNVLISKDRGGFDEVTTLKNKPHYEILTKLNLSFKNAGKNDLILVYYSGHGKCNSAGRLHLATPNTTIDAIESTSISVGNIKELIDVSSAHKIVIILDCCYSGAIGKEFIKGSVNDQLQMASESRGTYIMTASSSLQVAKEKKDDAHGIFTKHIIGGIQSGDADLDQNGYISIDELYSYVHEKVTIECHQKPELYNPHRRGDLIIACSGRTPRSERNRQLLKLLFEMGKDGLPKEIFDKARDIIEMDVDKISGVLLDYDTLLDKLLCREIVPLEFTKEWCDIRDEPINHVNQNGRSKYKKILFLSSIISCILFAILILALKNSWIAETFFVDEDLIESSRGDENDNGNEQQNFGIGEYAEKKNAEIYIPVEGRLIVKTDPKDALIRFLNTKERFSQEMTLKPRRYHLEVSATGYETKRQWIDIKTGERKKLDISLKEIVETAKLFVDTKPKDSQIRILNIRPEFNQGIELSPGRYNIEISAAGFDTQRKWINLVSGENRISTLLKISKRSNTRKNSLGMVFVYIKPGIFMMGSPLTETGRDDSEKQHKVTLSQGFYIQTTEVTQGQYYEVMGTRPWIGKSYVKIGDSYPAVYVSWHDSQNFIRKLNSIETTRNYRLPTEAEWEYVCRAGSTAMYYFGKSDSDLVKHAWSDKNAWNIGNKYAHQVRKKEPNPWGVYDMYGNVWEWCEDLYNEYPDDLANDPICVSGGMERVLRGGSWSNLPAFCRSANRNRHAPSYKSSSVGFRLLQEE